MYNSLPDHGHTELAKESLFAMRAFCNCKFHCSTGVLDAEMQWKDCKFNATVDVGKHPLQENGNDCGMCVASTALSLARGSSTTTAPAVYPSLSKVDGMMPSSMLMPCGCLLSYLKAFYTPR